TRGAQTSVLAEHGLTVHTREDPGHAVQVPAHTADLEHAPDADVLVLAVKTYSLEAVAASLRDRYGDAPLIIALQNGVANQSILPRYFSRVVYGVVSYNAWLESPGTIGCQRRGPIVLGVLSSDRAAEAQHLVALFNTA